MFGKSSQLQRIHQNGHLNISNYGTTALWGVLCPNLDAVQPYEHILYGSWFQSAWHVIHTQKLHHRNYEKHESMLDSQEPQTWAILNIIYVGTYTQTNKQTNKQTNTQTNNYSIKQLNNKSMGWCLPGRIPPCQSLSMSQPLSSSSAKRTSNNPFFSLRSCIMLRAPLTPQKPSPGRSMAMK